MRSETKPKTGAIGKFFKALKEKYFFPVEFSYLKAKSGKPNRIISRLEKMPVQSYIILNCGLPLIIVSLIFFAAGFKRDFAVDALGAVLDYREDMKIILSSFAVCICSALFIDIINMRNDMRK